VKIGLFGGTFDPIHNGHMKVAQAAKNFLQLDQVLFIPAGDPPHKADKKISNKEVRLAMVRLAAEPEGALVSDWEIRQEKKSYSVDMIRHFRELYPADELYFIIGADSFYDMPTWWHYRELLGMCTFVVIARPETNRDDLLARYSGDEVPPRVFFLEDLLVDISSTQIRKLAAEGKAFSHLVPPAVHAYIQTNNLYTNGGENGTGND